MQPRRYDWDRTEDGKLDEGHTVAKPSERRGSRGGVYDRPGSVTMRTLNEARRLKSFSTKEICEAVGGSDAVYAALTRLLRAGFLRRPAPARYEIV